MVSGRAGWVSFLSVAVVCACCWVRGCLFTEVGDFGPSWSEWRAAPSAADAHRAEFRGSPEARRRYWGCVYIGWRRIVAARPNAGHRAVAALQLTGVLRGIITQNVDGLHQAAGARDVVELHGALDRVVCRDAAWRSTREAVDQQLRAANPIWTGTRSPLETWM